MTKTEILDRIRNRLTLPMTVLQLLGQESSKCERAVDEMRDLIKEIENDENPNH